MIIKQRLWKLISVKHGSKQRGTLIGTMGKDKLDLHGKSKYFILSQVDYVEKTVKYDKEVGR